MALSLATFQASAFNTTTTPKTVTLPSVTAGDLLIVSVLIEENSTGATINTPTSAGVTFTEIGSPLNAANNSFMRRWKATMPSTASNVVISETATSTGSAFHWGFATSLWHSDAGLKVETSTEAHAQTTATDTISLALVGATSGVHLHFADWNQATATAYTITPSAGGTRQVSTADTGRFSVVVATWTGKTGTIGFGVSAPTATEKWTQFAQAVVEAQSVALPVGALTLTGVAPSGAAGGGSVTLPTGAMTLTGVAVTGASSGVTSVAIPVGTLTLAGNPPTAARGVTSFFYEPFTYSNGTLANGWGTIGATLPTVNGNKLVTASTALVGAGKTHSQDVTDDWQIDFDATAPLQTGNGGVTVGLVDLGTGEGYAVFVGNAVHVQRYSPSETGGHLNITNVGRTGENTPGVLANHVTMTFEKALNRFTVFLDTVQWAQVVDNVGIVAGPTCIISLQDTDHPTFDAVLDEIYIQNAIGSPPPTAQLPLTGVLTLTGVAPTAAATGAVTVALPTGALTLTGVAPTAAGSGAISIALTPGDVTLTGVAPSGATGGATEAIPTGSLSLVGNPVTAAPTGEATTAQATGALTLTGVAPTAAPTGEATVALPVGTLSLAGNPPTATGTGVATTAAPVGALTLTGVPVNGSQNVEFVDLPVGVLTLTGVAPTATGTGAGSITLTPGTITLTGVAPTAAASGTIAVAQPIGQLTLTGVAPIASNPQTVAVPVGALTLLGIAVAVLTGRPPPFPSGAVTGGHRDPDAAGGHDQPAATGSHLVPLTTGGHNP